MQDYNLTEYNLPEYIIYLQEALKETPNLLMSGKDASAGNWGMARLWRAWMSTTAEFMAGNGATMPLLMLPDGTYKGSRPYNKDDAHEAFTHYWLGTDDDNNRLSWSRGGREGMRAATKGERFHALQKHEQWAIEKGIILFNPIDSEYRELQQESEK